MDKSIPNGTTRRTFERLLLLETDECVLWPHGTNRAGYGRATLNGKKILTHRAALIRRVGPCPPGMEACHARGITCRKHCMNYRHLRWDTRASNVADALADGTAARGERIGGHKLSEDDVRVIRSIVGRTQRAIAAEFGVSQAVVGSIRRREAWVHVV